MVAKKSNEGFSQFFIFTPLSCLRECDADYLTFSHTDNSIIIISINFLEYPQSREVDNRHHLILEVIDCANFTRFKQNNLIIILYLACIRSDYRSSVL